MTKLGIGVGILATAFCLSVRAQTINVLVPDQAPAQTVLQAARNAQQRTAPLVIAVVDPVGWNAEETADAFQFESWRGCDTGKAPPNPWRIATEEAQVIALITPGDFTHAFNKMNAPAEQMELRSDTYTVTYANADLTDTIKVFEQYELRMLTADKIRAETRQDPL